MSNKPIIGITLGDPSGIGSEITAKLLAKSEVYDKCNPIVIGDSDSVKDGIRIAGNGLQVNSIKNISDAKFEFKTVDVYDLDNITLGDFEYGKVSKAAGKASGEFIEKAIDLALKGEIDAVVTNPINKESFKLGGYGIKYPGHTEMFADLTGTKKYSMMLAHENLRVFHVTTHIALDKVPNALSIERIYDVIKLANSTCIQLGIDKPRIGVAGLNPHAGENGLFGSQEERFITPAIEKAKKEGILANGPVPPDTLFCKAKGNLYDCVVVMYHDQGHIPVKYAGFIYSDENKEWIVRGVNVTLGLPVIRTSVDHGTAYGKAGKGTADYMSLYDALDYAILMAKGKTNS
jgi:4-phospho-D-threonate 3-dehydrogenase / 4-phospho-D-erythronate 3-dehydrogenase